MKQRHIWFTGALIAACATWVVAQQPIPGAGASAALSPFVVVSSTNPATATTLNSGTAQLLLQSGVAAQIQADSSDYIQVLPGGSASITAAGGINLSPAGGYVSSTTFQFKGPGFVNAGATFTASGCGTPTSLTGGAFGGSFLAQAASCTAVLTTGFTMTNGYGCSVWDVTTTADTLKETAYNATTVTLSGTVVIGDKIVFNCSGF